jgi:multidrug transporter EmrE-like cation transporter
VPRVALGLYVTFYAALNTCGLLLLRVALRDRDAAAGLPATLRDPRLAAGLVLYALGFLTWVASLSRYELSTVYPVFVGVSYVAVVLASALVLSEDMTAAKIIGIALVGAGVMLVVR